MTTWRQDDDVQMLGVVPNGKGVGGTKRGNHFRNTAHVTNGRRKSLGISRVL